MKGSLTYIWFICLISISIMSKALGLQTLGDKLLADLAASWWFLLLGLYFSFVSALFLFICFPLLMLLFFVGLGLKEDSPSSNMLRFLQNIPRCSSFFGCCSSLGFGNEVNSQFLTAIATNIVHISQITNKLAFSPTIDLLTNGGQRHLSEVDI